MPSRPIAGRYFLVGFILLCALIVADQYAKWLVIETMLRNGGPRTEGFLSWLITLQKIDFLSLDPETFKTVTLTPFLNFVMVWNKGISFGLLDAQAGNNGLLSLLLIASSLLIALLLILWLALTPRKLTALALALIAGGALGNVIDRVRFGAVADFIDLHLGDRHWPAFNLADSCIVAGAVLLALAGLFGKGEQPHA